MTSKDQSRKIPSFCSGIPLGLIVCIEDGPLVRRTDLSVLARGIVEALPEFEGCSIDDLGPLIARCAGTEGFLELLTEHGQDGRSSVFIFEGLTCQVQDPSGNSEEIVAHVALLVAHAPGSRPVVVDMR